MNALGQHRGIMVLKVYRHGRDKSVAQSICGLFRHRIDANDAEDGECRGH